MDISPSLIAELEDSIRSGSKDKRVDSLRRITDLFVADADRLNDQQIDVFDDVLGHLIKRIEGKALAELSRRLGPINNAPIEVVRRLARDDNIAVAEPILMHCQGEPLRGHCRCTFVALRCAAQTGREPSAERPSRGASCTLQSRRVGVPTVRMILNCRSVGRTLSDHDIDAARADYTKLSQSSARRVLRYWQVRQTATNDVANPATPSQRVSPASTSPIPVHK
jgi:hypothetical protein